MPPLARTDGAPSGGARRRLTIAGCGTARTGESCERRIGSCHRSRGSHGAREALMNPQYPLVAERANHRCEYCRAPESPFNFPHDVEHITPRSRGGSDHESNLALACRSCNLFKMDRESAENGGNGQSVRLFNPRFDIWEDHFAVDTSTCEIQGKTPIGRATIAGLHLNSTRQIAARRQWISLQLFP